MPDIARFARSASLSSPRPAAILGGSDGDDNFSGTSTADQIEGRGGNDKLDGLAGNDFIHGDFITAQITQTAPGADTIRGGFGDDTIDGGGGDDDIRGDAGADRLIGGLGNNTLDGGGEIGDTADYSWLSGGVSASLAQGFASGAGFTDLLSRLTGILGGAGADTLAGSASADQLDGGAGDDDLQGYDGNDSLSGSDGSDTLHGGAGGDTLSGGLLADSLLGGLGADRLIGGAGNNTLDGGGDSLLDTADYRWTTFSAAAGGVLADLLSGLASGAGFSDTLLGIRSVDGGAGNDTLGGNALANTLRGYAGADLLTGLGGNDVLVGDDNGGTVAPGNDTLQGGAGNDTLRGGGGDDLLEGGAGNDSLQGGAGNNTLSGGGSLLDTADYRVASGPVVVSLLSGTATGAGFSDVLSGLPSVSGSNFADQITGGAAANTLYGGAGNDTLRGMAGNDTLFGEDGDDSLLGGDGDDVLDGGAGNDTLDGGAGTDDLGGGAGNNLLIGGGYEDTADYHWDEAGVLVNLADGVATGSSFSDTLIGFNSVNGSQGNDTLKGSSLDDQLRGREGDDQLEGNDGNDRLRSDAGNDTLLGGAGDDDLDGGDDNDLLDGGTGDDTLSGGLGFNTLSGGLGFDTIDYSFVQTGLYVDLTANTVQGAGIGDELSGFEAVALGSGNDTVVGGGVSYRGAVRGVTVDLSSQGSQNTGSSGFDTLLNVVSLEGSGFNDQLQGNEGDNRIDGFLGSDTMSGGAGDDYYIVDDINDVVIESAQLPGSALASAVDLAPEVTAGSGIDTVESTVSFLLAANIENLILKAGSGALVGTGNELANALTGNGLNNVLLGLAGADTLVGGAGNDTLSGGAGDDSMLGGAGDDTYVVDSAFEAAAVNARLVELAGEGTDTVQSSVTFILGAEFEKLILTGVAATNGTGNAVGNAINGNAGANTLKGLWGNDTLVGGDGADSLFGNGGSDTLTGGAGADRFCFDTAFSASTNLDTITDFVSASDKIQLDDDIAGAFVALTSPSVAQGSFISGAGLTAARDADDFLIYNTSTGDLYYDRDGSGAAAAIKFALLTAAPALTAGDFVIVD